jgi:hypothetical protein
MCGLFPAVSARALGQTIAPPNAEYPYSYQASIGVQRQIGGDMGVTADYSFNGQRKDRVTGYNINLSFNPDTGLNYPFTDISHRPYPEWGQVPMDIFEGRSNYPGARDVIHQAHESPLAGVGHVYPVTVRRRTAGAVERRHESRCVRGEDAARRRVRTWRRRTSAIAPSSTASGRRGMVFS